MVCILIKQRHPHTRSARAPRGLEVPLQGLAVGAVLADEARELAMVGRERGVAGESVLRLQGCRPQSDTGSVPQCSLSVPSFRRRW